MTLALCSLALLACAASPQQDWGARVKAANDELLNQGDLGRLGGIFAPNYVLHTSSGDVNGGPDVIASFVNGLRAAFPDLHVDVQILVTHGDTVVWLRTHHGTQQADYAGVPATHRVITWRDMVVSRYDAAGKIAEEWGVSDLGERLRVP